VLTRERAFVETSKGRLGIIEAHAEQYAADLRNNPAAWVIVVRQRGLMPYENERRRRMPWSRGLPWESSYSVLGPER